MSSKSPLARVKEEFGGKDKLVDKIVGLVDVGDESKDDLRKRLLGAANSKLIRLHAVATNVKKQGGHDKLVTNVAQSLKRPKDKDYVEKLSTFSDARLLDILQGAERRVGREGAPAGGEPPAGGAKVKARAKAGPKTGTKTGKTPARTKGAAEKSA